jgi:hypothetical protein
MTGLVDDPTQNLRELLSDLGDQLPRLEARVAGTELYGAPRLSVFHLLGPNELALSRVIADLLDCHGSHGQGELFLNSLLEKADLPRVKIRESVYVAREVLTSEKRRIDIVVESPTLVLGIENKPWAGQLLNQLKDYREDLEKRGNAAKKASALVFLSDQHPETAGDRIILMSYRPQIEDGLSLYNVLGSVIGSIKAERTRAFVQNFMEYIDVQFGEGRMSKEQDDPYVQAVQAEFEGGSAKRKALATVLLSQRVLHRRIISEIGDFVLGEVRKVANDFESGHVNTESWTFKPGNTPLRLEKRHEAWGVRRPSWPLNCIIAICSDKGDHQSIYYGVYALDPSSEEAKEYPAAVCMARPRLERLAQEVAGSKSDSWPWFRYADPPNWGPEFAARIVLESPDADIGKHQGIQELARTIARLAEAVDRALVD